MPRPVHPKHAYFEKLVTTVVSDIFMTITEEQGLKTGDIDPGMVIALSNAEDTIIEVVEAWFDANQGET